MLFKDFSNESALALLNKGALLLDIRSMDEFCSGHIKGAILIETPVPPLDEKLISNLRLKIDDFLKNNVPNKNTNIVVYCRKGIRAGYAKKIIQDLGYKNVISWGGVVEQPLKDLFDTKLNICYCYKNHDYKCKI